MDQSRAAVPEGSVLLVEAATNAPAVATTTSDGVLLFTRVGSGRYRLTVEKPGLRQHVRESLDIAVNEQVVLDVILDLGAVEDSVTVEGGRAPAPRPAGARRVGWRRQQPGGLRLAHGREFVHTRRRRVNDERWPLGGLALGGGAADLAPSQNVSRRETGTDFG